MSANNESKPSVRGEGGLEFYTNNRFAKSSPVFNNFLNTFVPDCTVEPLVIRFCPKQQEELEISFSRFSKVLFAFL